MTPHPRHLLIVLALILAACGGNPTPQVISFVPSVTPGALVPTRQPTATPTPVLPTATATFTPEPTDTPTPATPIAQAVRDIPVRGGPGANYAVLTMLGPDEQLDIVGISEDGSWYQVRLGDGTTGWLTSASAQVSVYGDLRSVPVALAPTETPTFTPSATLPPTATPTATVPPSSTPLPTRTPLPTVPGAASLPIFVADGLALAGVMPDNGQLADQFDEKVVDLTGEDELVKWDDFDGSPTDFIAGVTIAWGPGATEDACGLIFRETDGENFYAVRISRDGVLWFVPMINNEWKDNAYGDSTLIRTGIADLNQLNVVAIGDTFVVYLNGEYAGYFKDATFAGGDIGVSASTYDESDESNCTFTDGWLWEPETAPSLAGAVPDFVPQALADADLTLDSGFLAARQPRRLVDLSEDDDKLRRFYFDGSYADFVAGTTITWGPGATEDYCGVTLRKVDEDNYYMIQIDQDQQLSFSRRIEGEWLEDLVSGNSLSVATGEGATNDLMIYTVGDTFRVYVNGQYIDQFQDATLAGGQVGVVAGTFDESGETYCVFNHTWLWQLGAPPVSGEKSAITVGETVQGQIEDTAPAAYYTFDAQAGDVIGIRMNRTSGDLDPYLVLLGPDGARLVENDDDPQGFNRDAFLRDFVLPVTGTYTIMATRFQEADGTTRGNFTLTLEVGELVTTAIQIGDRVEGEIDATTWAVRYTFEAQADEMVRLEMNRTSGDLDPLIIVLDADGKELARNDDEPVPRNYDAIINELRIPADGTYTVIATRFQEADGLSSGGFTLAVSRSPNA